VSDMSAQPITPTDPTDLDVIAEQCTWTVRGRNPYADTPTDVLIDTLEHRYDRGEDFIPELVFEIANRLIDAEGVGLPPSAR
jgi:hypothetical protein